jgi:homocysteine S-methyltransferase
MTVVSAAKYRHRLPQLDGRLFLTDGGLETTLIFHEGWELPGFASFVLHETEDGRAALRAYFDRYIAMAVEAGAGYVLECATWRANPDWGARLGYGRAPLERINRAAIDFAAEIRKSSETRITPIVISGNIGPRGDGYDPGRIMSVDEAEAYHAWQIGIFHDTAADMVSAFTMTNVEEATGVARAAARLGMPCVISFTVETDGHLPSGQPLKDALAEVDAATGASPLYYMINCAHPVHFDHVLEPGAGWTKRLRGIRANASRCSHAELDNATELDIGDPGELGRLYSGLRRRFPQLTVLGGCCGTDHRHVRSISEACLAAA